MLNLFAVEIFVEVIRGSLDVIANGGNGHKGQDGGNGEDEGDLGKVIISIRTNRYQS